MAQLKKNIAKEIHLEAAGGTAKHNLDYCTKEDSRVEGTEPIVEGEFPKPGQRNDLATFAETAWTTRSKYEVAQEFPGRMLKYSTHWDRLRGLKKPPVKKDMYVEVHYGKSRTGKSHYCEITMGADLGEEVCVLGRGNSGVWFDNYDGEDILVIDEFHGWIRIDKFKRMLDGYRYWCEKKGGGCWLLATKIRIISNRHPKHWYPNVYAKYPEEWNAMRNRFDKVYYWSEYGVKEEVDLSNETPNTDPNPDFVYEEDLEPSP